MSTRLLIPCAGPMKRWDEFKDVPKHQVKLAGERLIDRTVRIARDVDPDIDIRIVVPDLSDDGYRVDGSTRLTAKTDETAGDIAKLTSSQGWWNKNGRTVIAWGDVWFEADVLADMLTAAVDDWHAWLRISGDGGELFGFAWNDDMNARIGKACEDIAAQHRSGALNGTGYKGLEVRGGWALYRTLSGVRIDNHGNHGHATVVDGWTEDMDSPTDWHRWCAKWARTPKAQRPS